MQTIDLGGENALRLMTFVAVTMLMIVWERVSPAFVRQFPIGRRWPTNFGMGALNTALLPIVMPLLAVEMAVRSQAFGWGLFTVLNLPPLISSILFVVLFDCTIYWQHRLFHVSSALWRLHRVHHMDLEVDVSTGVRFHPLSILISLIVKLALIAMLAPPPIAVVVAEVLLNVSSMFNHGNVYLPRVLDQTLRWLVVTPSMHRAHHSIDPSIRDHNFGFNLSIWDRLFGTYLNPNPQGTQTGVSGFGEDQSQEFLPALLSPLDVQRIE